MNKSDFLQKYKTVIFQSFDLYIYIYIFFYSFEPLRTSLHVPGAHLQNTIHFLTEHEQNVLKYWSCKESLCDVTDPMNVYCGGACLERPKIRISQMAASVESLGMNLIHNLLFLNAGSSGERKRGTGHDEESERHNRKRKETERGQRWN